MITKRIIPCLDIRDGQVVKGVKFKDVKNVEDPVAMARFYNESGADELVFYDITATVGGSINSLDDFDRVLKAGADKVSVNSGAIKNPQLISAAAEKYGDQCVVLSMDVARVDGNFHVFAKGGREDTGMDAVEWAVQGEKLGAGELVINSIDADGVRGGFDLPMLEAIAEKIDVPIIASGGAGKMEDFLQLFALPGIDAGLAASIFHFRQVDIKELKVYLSSHGIQMR